MKAAKILLLIAFVSNIVAFLGSFAVFSQMKQTYAALDIGSPSIIPLVIIGISAIASFTYWLFMKRKTNMADDSLPKVFGIILIILPWLVMAYLAVSTISPLYDVLGGVN